MTKKIQISDWDFYPETASLVRGEECKRLEYRAAAVLELLCTSDGAVLSQETMIEEIWAGRSQSPNSIAVVIANIRQALGDDARNPTYIETVPKRGYLVIAPVTLMPAGNADSFSAMQNDSPEPNTVLGNSKRFLGLVAISTLGLLALLTAYYLFAAQETKQDLVLIHIGTFDNQTGRAQHSKLQPAMAELSSTELMRFKNSRLVKKEDAEFLVRGKIIIWNGGTAVALHADDLETGQTIWSGMASGPEEMLPTQVRVEFKNLGALLSLK